MGISCGIVGLPNVGKSTLFNALTHSQVPAENYPFCTINPNVGIVAVPDHRLETISAVVKPKRTVAAVVKFVDIAGFVRGASKGQGLGSKYKNPPSNFFQPTHWSAVSNLLDVHQ